MCVVACGVALRGVVWYDCGVCWFVWWCDMLLHCVVCCDVVCRGVLCRVVMCCVVLWCIVMSHVLVCYSVS